MLKTPIGQVRAVGMIEGFSFVVLLGIAMPLKYLWSLPMAVTVVGMIHGILFLVFCGVLMNAKQVTGWGLGRTGGVLVAALLPFGPFVIDGSLRREDELRRAAMGGAG